MAFRAMSAAFLLFYFLRVSYADESLHFLVLGDWGMGNDQQMATAALMKRTAASESSAFVLNVGDNFYKETKDAQGKEMGGVTNLTDPLWKKYFEDVYTDNLEKLPFFSTLGNHDYMGNTSAQLLYHTLDERWVLPQRYYTREMTISGNPLATLIFMDTSPFIQDYYDNPRNQWMKDQLALQDYQTQLTWLDTTLAAVTTKWKIVVGHHPIVSHAGKNLFQAVDADRSMALVQPILNKHGVQAYFCGHIHDLQHLNAENIDYFISGGGAFGKVYTPDEMMSSFVNFKSDAAGVMSVTLSAEQMESRFLATNGTVLHTAVTKV